MEYSATGCSIIQMELHPKQLNSLTWLKSFYWTVNLLGALRNRFTFLLTLRAR
ncbi:unnamed protein product, partial [Ceratitis capitata]